MDRKEVILKAVVRGVQVASQRPDNDLKQQDVSAVAGPVIDAVEPYIEHITDTENALFSRSVWAAFIAALAGLLGLFGIILPAEFTGKFLDFITAAGPLVSAGLIIYSRWFAKKPLFK